MNKVFQVLVIFFTVLAFWGCGGHDEKKQCPCDNNCSCSAANNTEEVEYLGDSNPFASWQYSIPRYDGSAGHSPGFFGVGFTSNTTNYYSSMSYSEAIFTFKLSDLASAKQIGLMMKVTSVQADLKDGQSVNDVADIERLKFYVLKTGNSDYESWQDCVCSGSDCNPDGCEIFHFGSFIDKSLYFTLESNGDGWFILCSEEFKNFLLANYQRGDYFSIYGGYPTFRTGQHSSLDLHFENGENYEGSGDIPYMFFVY